MSDTDLDAQSGQLPLLMSHLTEIDLKPGFSVLGRADFID
jgi:hypothetical protein